MGEVELKNNITVSLSEYAKPVMDYEVPEGTKITDFLKEHGLSLNADIRINDGEIPNSNYLLQPDDVILVVGEVSGGR